MLYKNYQKVLDELKVERKEFYKKQASKEVFSDKVEVCICDALHRVCLKLPYKQRNNLRVHFITNKPTKTKHISYYREVSDRGLWWPATNEGYRLRELFLKKLIKQTTPWYIKLIKSLNKNEIRHNAATF